MTASKRKGEGTGGPVARARFPARHGHASQCVMGPLPSASRRSTRSTLASGLPSLRGFTSVASYPRRNTFFKFQCPKLQTDRQTLRWGVAVFKPSQVFQLLLVLAFVISPTCKVGDRPGLPQSTPSQPLRPSPEESDLGGMSGSIYSMYSKCCDRPIA